ncbi:N-acetyl-gamma-glutamyl-phosphate reductase [bacterium]|nr:N-acetyl-gamma-glutamyl-phosphate reductase [bacterium]
MIRVGIAGASGYTGIELIRLLNVHPSVIISGIYSKSQVGTRLSQIYPQFSGLLDLSFEALSPDTLSEIDVLFLALPHGQAQAYYEMLAPLPLKVIDLSADFRLNRPEQFKRYYKDDHLLPHLLGAIPLGQPELFRDQIRNADYVACPGCYATSVMLGAYPLSQLGLLNHPIVVDAKSGVSGAGRGLKESSLFCEANESFSSYGTYTHRHVPEMEMVLGAKVLFSPHLVPMNRGILSTIYVDIPVTVTRDQIVNTYSRFYAESPFVSVMPELANGSTKYVSGTNRCMISFVHCPDIGKLVVFSALDNLIKGASGQAIQCMNIMMGLEETVGLPLIPHYL